MKYIVAKLKDTYNKWIPRIIAMVILRKQFSHIKYLLNIIKNTKSPKLLLQTKVIIAVRSQIKSSKNNRISTFGLGL